MPVVLSDQPTPAEVRSKLAEAGEALGSLITKPEDERGETWGDDIRVARATIENLDPLLTALERSEPPQARGPEAAFTEVHGPDTRSVGQRITDDEGLKNFVDSNRQGSSYHEIQMRGSIHEARALIDTGTTTYTTTDAGAWLPVGQPIPPPARQQRMFIRDVLNVVRTGLHAVPYVRELNAFTNETGATAVAEGVAKPEVTMQFEGDVALIQKIAAWVPVTEEIIADAPTLQGYINTRLGYMVALREERELLNGGGNAPNIKGIRNYAIQTQNVVASDFPATIGKAIGLIENVDLDADFVAANPLDFWTAVTTRHANPFDNGFGGNAPAVLSQITWGLPAVRTRSMESGKALVGSSMAATVFDREETAIRIGNQHSTFFTENKVAILAEERIGLAVSRIDGFVEATVPTS